MALPIVSTDMTAISLAESLTGWAAGPALSGGIDRQGSFCVTQTCETGACLFTFTPAASINLTNKGVYFWFASIVPMDILANAGIKLKLNSAGASSTWNVAGSDTIPSQGWTPFCVDVNVTPDVTTGGGVAIAAVTSMDFTYTTIGTFDVVEPNTFIDAVRHGQKISIKGGGELAWDTGAGTIPVVGQTVTNATQTGTGIIVKVTGTVTAGTMTIRAKTGAFADNDSISTATMTSALVNSPTGVSLGVPATFQDIIDFENLPNEQNGIVYVWDQIMLVQGILEIGSSVAGEVTVFDDDSRIIKFRDDSIVLDGFHKFQVIGETYLDLGSEVGTAPDSIGVQGGSIIAATNNFDLVASDAAILRCDFFGVTIDGANSINWGNAVNRMVSPLIQNSGLVTLAAGAEIRDGVIASSTSIAGIGAILINTNPVTPEFRDMSLINNIHAIESETVGPTTLDLRNIQFSGNTADIRFNHASGLLTVNVLEGGNTPTTSDGAAGGTIIIIAGTVTTTIKVTDNNGVNLQNARVLARAATGGPEPFEDVVTIARVTTVATVTHTAHGFAVGDKVQIKGITDKIEDNAVQTIVTVPGVNSYTYTTTNSGSTSYTGTILATAVYIDGLTNVSGLISDTRVFASNQPLAGFVRKSSASPRFKSFNLSGNTIDSITGLTVNIRMILDE